MGLFELVFTLMASAAPQHVPVPIEGVVVDVDGRPLAGATVTTPGSEVVQTAPDGTFRVADASFIVRVHMAGYQPVTRAHSLPRPVVLRRATAPPDVIPRCPPGTSPSVHGFNARLSVPTPRGVRHRVGADIDYGTSTWQTRGAVLQHGAGPMWSFGVPPPVLLERWQDVEEREVSIEGAPDVMVTDMRGRHADGASARFVGILGETFTYEGASPAAAAAFDRMLAAMCYVEPARQGTGR